MKKKTLQKLDLILTYLIEIPHGHYLATTTLLQEVQLKFTKEHLFLIDILLSDSYIEALEVQNRIPIIRLTPNGFKFHYSGGYVNFYQNNMNDLMIEQHKLKLEIVNLRLGLIISVISLTIAISSFIISLWKTN